MKASEPKNQKAKDLLDSKVEAIYKEFYDDSDNARADKKDEALNAALDKVCDPILLQAYLCQISGRPYDVASEGDAAAVKRYRDDAVEAFATPGGITQTNIEDALEFESNQNTWGTWGNPWYKIGRTLSGLPYGLARIPGNVATNIADLVSGSPVASAFWGSAILVGVSMIFPGALPFAILYGAAIVLTTAIVSGIKAINDTGPGKIAFKALGVLGSFPLDLAVTLLVGMTAIVSSISSGKTIAETMDQIGYKPFAIGRAILAESPPIKPKNFNEHYNKSAVDNASEKAEINRGFNDLSTEEQTKAFGDKAISKHLEAEGILKVKLEEFFSRNPSEAQVKTMLTGNPELQSFIEADAALKAQLAKILPPGPAVTSGVDPAVAAADKARREAAAAVVGLSEGEIGARGRSEERRPAAEREVHKRSHSEPPRGL